MAGECLEMEENTIFRRMKDKVAGRQGKLRDETLHNLYSSPWSPAFYIADDMIMIITNTGLIIKVFQL
jgi:hypothetical protein